MRKFYIPIAAAAALTLVAADATPAKAQYIVTGGYASPVYYGGYAPSSYAANGLIGAGGFGLGSYPMYTAGYSSYYGNSYGYPAYSNYGYRTSYGAYGNYYGGSGYGYGNYYGGSGYGYGNSYRGYRGNGRWGR